MERASAPRLVAVRCDGDARLGAGHVARCLPLALALREHAWRPVFVGRFAGLAEWLLGRAGLESRPPVEGRRCGLSAQDWDAAILDLYGAPEAEVCGLAAELPLVTIAEASRCAGAGTWIDYHLDRAGEPPSPSEFLGPAYAPLQRELPTLRRAMDRPVSVALVATGGSVGARGIADAAVAALRSTFPGVRIVAGSGVRVAEGVESLPFPGTLFDAMADADVAVSTAGLTAYELACAGVPAVLVAVAPNQGRVLDGSRRAGTAIVAGPDCSLSGAVARLADPGERARTIRNGIASFDGAGAARAAAMLDRAWRGGDPLEILLRRAVPGDRDRLLVWRNDPVTLEGSFSAKPVAEADHDRWLTGTLADPDRRLFVAEEAGVPVGQLRLDRDGSHAEVSISVAPAARGRGVALRILAAADTEAALWGLDALEARVKPSNDASLRLFRAAGYREDGVAAEGERVLLRPVPS